jgi:hypothetical protein
VEYVQLTEESKHKHGISPFKVKEAKCALENRQRLLIGKPQKKRQVVKQQL